MGDDSGKVIPISRGFLVTGILKRPIPRFWYATVYLDWGSKLISPGGIAKTFLFVMFREADSRSF
jgi:hypothetical protein